MRLIIFGLLLAAAPAQEAARTTWDGIYTEKQSERGQELYAQHCAACHSDTLTGGEQAPPLTGPEFLANWGSLTVGDLFERVRTTMPPGRASKLNRQINADVISYMLKVGGYPAGEAELSTATEVLKQIRIVANRPEKSAEKK